MPYVLIQVTREGVTAPQKAELIRRSTDMLVEVLGKEPATTFVVIDEVDTDNWGVAGETVTVRRARAAAAAAASGAETGPRQQIEALVGAYLDGLYHCDVPALREVFHPRALYGTAAGPQPVVLTMDEYLPQVAQRDPPARTAAARRERILSVDIVGPHTAHVKLACSFFGKDYVDLLSLVRVEGRWRIIAKVFHYTLATAG